MTDELRQRLARIDPMHSDVPTESTAEGPSRELLEQIMSTPTKERQIPQSPQRRTWIAVAAVTALLVAIAAGIGLGGDTGTPSIQDKAPIALEAGTEDLMAICIAFSPEELERSAELAFAGTVTAVEGNAVTLTVDNWFRGGDDATEVVLNAPQGMEALIGGFPFAVGDQYLISAQSGTVNYCGFSGAATPELRTAFETAFPQG